MNYNYLLLAIILIIIGIIGMYKNQFWKNKIEDSYFKVRLFGSYTIILIIGLFCLFKI